MSKLNFNDLNEDDIYAYSLFLLHKLRDIPEYMTSSELPYVLDQTNLLRLCQFFGGRTIKIPTQEELYEIMYLILLYQYVKIDKMDYDKAIDMLKYKPFQTTKLKVEFKKMCEILNRYNFSSRSKNE